MCALHVDNAVYKTVIKTRQLETHHFDNLCGITPRRNIKSANQHDTVSMQQSNK